MLPNARASIQPRHQHPVDGMRHAVGGAHVGGLDIAGIVPASVSVTLPLVTVTFSGSPATVTSNARPRPAGQRENGVSHHPQVTAAQIV